MRPETKFLIKALFLCGMMSVGMLMLVVWLLCRKPKPKKEKKKSYPDDVNWLLDLDEHEKVISE